MNRHAAIAVSAAALFVQACATVPDAPPPPRFTRPAADRLARLQPFDRGALEIDGEFLRLAVVPPEASTVAGVPVRRGGAPGPTIVAIREEAGAPVYSYVGPAAAWRDGLVSRSAGLPIALQAARDASPFHEPLASRIGQSEVWCTLDKVPRAAGAAAGFRLTLALSSGNPRARAAPGAPAPGGRGGARGGPRSMDQEIAAKVGAASAVPFAILELELADGPDGRARGALGLAVGPSTPAAVPLRGQPPVSAGARVEAVSAGSPAERAGILTGDVVLEVDGRPVASDRDLAALVGAREPFSPLNLTVQRGAERQQFTTRLGQRATSRSLVRHLGAIAMVGDVWLEPDGRLAALSFPPWRPAPEFFLAGKTARDVWSQPDRATEQAINDGLVEWKTRQLPGWLRQSTGAQLEDAIVATEKGILALDVAVRSVKDQIDAAARKNETAFAGAGEIEQLLEQRKMLLGVVLQAMKGAAAQKVR